MTSAERRRKIEALRALAERPGTPAEGEAAKRALERVMATKTEPEYTTTSTNPSPIFDLEELRKWQNELIREMLGFTVKTSLKDEFERQFREREKKYADLMRATGSEPV